jgi:cystathionine beta-lyase family protein involved in aluminum resistance
VERMSRLVYEDNVVALINEEIRVIEIQKEQGYKSKIEELRHIKDCVEHLPTAFNKEAVIKQIQEYAECKEECKNNFYYGQGCKACAWNKMIEIVKAGGIDG